MVSLTLDIAILILLSITLGAGYRFHKRLCTFRADTEEFEPLVQALDNAARRAEAVLADLRQIAEEVGTKLSTEADNTQRLLDDLDFMTKRADQLADQLDSSISAARKQGEKQPTSAHAGASKKSSEVLTPTLQDPRRRAPDLEKRLKTLR